jgi:hypothetical protein
MGCVAGAALAGVVLPAPLVSWPTSSKRSPKTLGAAVVGLGAVAGLVVGGSHRMGSLKVVQIAD